MRRRFVLARLAEAVRRQDWFTAVVEVAVVVLGVVIGFQVTSWGQARSDRAREQVYLRQLAAELRETDWLIIRADSAAAVRDTATTRLLRASYEPPPPRDSVMIWLYEADYVVSVEPVLGTVEALVSTGDLSLIRDDSLRTALTRYLRDAREHVFVQQDQMQQWHASNRVMLEGLDPAEQYLSVVPPSSTDSLTRDPLSPFSSSPDRSPYRFDHEAYLSDPSVHRALFEMYVNQQNMRRSWTRLLRGGERLKQSVEAEIAE